MQYDKNNSGDMEEFIMKMAIILVILIGVLALLGTILIGGKGDNHYDTKTKANLSRLTWIYIILGIIILVGFAIYLR